MEMRFALQLPRDALSVPVVRRVLDNSLRTLGVAEECRTDIEVALTEACTNVLDHAVSDEEYEVVAGVADGDCVIDVVDAGRGFDADGYGHDEADHGAEAGRGIQLIRALVDQVHFRTPPETDGTVVHLEKTLVYDDDAPFKRLADRGADTAVFDLNRATTTLTERDEALDAGSHRSS